MPTVMPTVMGVFLTVMIAFSMTVTTFAMTVEIGPTVTLGANVSA